MSKKVVKPEQPPADEHAGMGGSYVMDPATGQRTLVSRTKTAADIEPVQQKEVNDDNADA